MFGSLFSCFLKTYKFRIMSRVDYEKSYVFILKYVITWVKIFIRSLNTYQGLRAESKLVNTFLCNNIIFNDAQTRMRRNSLVRFNQYLVPQKKNGTKSSFLMNLNIFFGKKLRFEWFCFRLFGNECHRYMLIPLM